ncbi:heat shock 70 kDa protein-like [Heteronotia binoei]|uniref:heat shock 70 kDa protein-like n=1 Tax=Heteronotia binoei TaxID=13085 RepID=UPI0029314A6B|nr:heat shock 70 kDa protein-like [Heteronotia binoei]
MGADLSHGNAENLCVGPAPQSGPRIRTTPARTRPKGPAVGIDLGTTYSCVAVCQKGRVDVIANNYGSRTTPSCVAFTDRERLVGEAAEMQRVLHPENTVFGAKRLIGRRYDDPAVQSSRNHWPFQVVGGEERVQVKVSYRGGEKAFYPEEISAMVLSRLKQVAEAYLGRPVSQAVITVPAYFNDAQRQATIDAAAIAGLKLLCLINEPSAAAIAYGLNVGPHWKAKRNILIFDLGGGTLDVSVLSIQNGVFDVMAISGDTQLGGEDFDQRLLNHLVLEFKKKHSEDISQSHKAMQRLKAACEKAKRALSSNVRATISVDSLYNGVDFCITITRACFEDLCADLFQTTMEHVGRVLEDAGIKKTQVHDIVLVGGSTRIPMIQNLLSKFFEGKELNKSINPEEVVAHGAAVQAAILTGHRYQNLENLLLLDVTPVSLGLETVGGVMDVLVKRNSPIPTKETRNFSTTEDNQTSLFLQVYEGERTLTKHNRLLGTVTLSGLQPSPRCVPVIVVTFAINHNNILTVSAMERNTGNSKQLVITDTRGRLDREEMERILKEEEELREQEKVEQEKIEALNSLESSTFQLKRTAEQGKSLDDRAKRRVLEMCEETTLWLEENQLAPKKEYEERKRELEDVCYSIITHFSKEDKMEKGC